MDAILKFLIENKYQLIEFAIIYLPTILFLFVVSISILLSALRGIRKTSIFLLHGVIAFTICIILFIALVDLKEVDAFILKTVNSIAGNESYMQNLFGSSSDCQTFREIFIEFIPKTLNFMDGLALIARENGKYLSSLVDVAYRLAFGIVLYFLYWILKFLMWIIYIIFFNERKYIRKREIKYENGLVDSPYRKRRILSSFIGLGRGLVVSLLMLSFIGMFYFIIAGGVGDKKREEMKFDNPDVQFAYDAYSEIESYGTRGIFKVLNVLKDEKNMPYYLFAANMIFKGRIEDDYQTTNVYMIDELATYVSFSRDTFDLFLKYDQKNILKMIADGEQFDIMTEITNVFQNVDFQRDFEKLITSFESKTYFINLTYSFIDSLSSHLTEVSFTKDLSEDILIPLRIMFEKGYLCDGIEYEKELAIKKEREKKSPSYNEDDYILGYIKPTELLTKDDIFTIYKLVVKYLTNAYEATGDGLVDILNILKESMTYIRDLSILDSSRSDELDGVLKRLYAYLEVKYLEGDSDIAYKIYDTDDTSYISPQYDSIHWVEELDLLLELVEKGFNIYENYFQEGKEMNEIIIDLFESDDKDIDQLISKLSSSKLVGELFTSKLIVDNVLNIIQGISPNITIPEYLSFGNIYDKDGHFVDFGELFYMFKGFKQIVNNPNGKIIFDSISGGMPEGTDMLTLLSNLLTAEVDGERITDSIVNSRIISSILSNYLIENSNITDDFSIYVDDSVLERKENGALQRIIKKEELTLLFNSIPTFIEVARPLIDNVDGEEPNQSDIINLINDERVISTLDSKIVEGSISLIIANKLSGDFIICPQSMKDGKNLVSIGDHYSEIKRIINVKNVLNIDLNDLLDGENDPDKIFGIFKNLSSRDIDILLSSNILYYTISNFLNEKTDTLFGDLELIIPESANIALEDDSIDKIIKPEILKDLINDISILAINDEIQMSELLATIIREKHVMDNYIISASVANALVNDESFITLRDIMGIDDTKYDKDHYGETSLLKGEFEKNPWYQESRSLINALNIILNLGPDDELKIEEIPTKIAENIHKLNEKIEDTKNTKLDKVYESDLFISTMSKKIDEMLTSQVIDENVRDLAKSSLTNYYRKLEISNMINVLNILGITFENINGLTPDTLMEHSGDDELYSSVIVRGIITKQTESIILDKGFEVIDKCYESEDVKVFKRTEFDAICALTGGNSLSTIDPNNIDINALSNLIYENGVTKSYLLVATASKYLLEEPTVVVPSGTIENAKYDNNIIRIISPKKLKELIDGINALGIEFNGFSLSLEDIKIPEDDDSIRIVCSSEILRATVTNNISINDSTNVYVENSNKYVSISNRIIKENNTYTYDNSSRIAILSEQELRCFMVPFKGQNVSSISFNPSYDDFINPSDDQKELLNSNIVSLMIRNSAPVIAKIENVSVIDLLSSDLEVKEINVAPKITI